MSFYLDTADWVVVIFFAVVFAIMWGEHAAEKRHRWEMWHKDDDPEDIVRMQRERGDRDVW